MFRKLRWVNKFENSAHWKHRYRGVSARVLRYRRVGERLLTAQAAVHMPIQLKSSKIVPRSEEAE